MNCYITTEYRSPYAAINSLWAAARQHRYIPDRIDLLTPDPTGTHALLHRDMLGELQRGLGKTPRVELAQMDPDRLSATRRVAASLIKARKMEGNRVAVDITPGRTIAKLALLQACQRERPDHLFYLNVGEYDYRDLPYVRIPTRLQESRDVLAEVLGDD